MLSNRYQIELHCDIGFIETAETLVTLVFLFLAGDAGY